MLSANIVKTEKKIIVSKTIMFEVINNTTNLINNVLCHTQRCYIYIYIYIQ